MEDIMHVSIRCVTNVQIYRLSMSSLSRIKLNHSDFNQQMNLVMHSILRMDRKFPLDYILHVPEQVKGRKKKQEILRLENILKNVVFRRILEIRN